MPTLTEQAEKINVNDLVLMRDGTSLTGYRFKSMHTKESGVASDFGIPASAFEVALYNEVQRLRKVIENLSSSSHYSDETER